MDEDGKKNDEQPAEHANDKQPPAKGLAEDQHKRVVDSQHGIDGGAATATNGKKTHCCAYSQRGVNKWGSTVEGKSYA
jgi:hypothetical protein